MARPTADTIVPAGPQRHPRPLTIATIDTTNPTTTAATPTQKTTIHAVAAANGSDDPLTASPRSAR